MAADDVTLRAEVAARRGGFDLRVALQVAAGEVVCVLGPNGAGKTTALRALAGLLPLTDGRVELAGAVLEDAAAGRRLPPERRPVGVVFQDGLLFPRMTARDNVAFGLRARGVPRRVADRTAEEWLERLGLAGLGVRRPAQLSGGQAQRVALARALAVDPALLLLDEPLAALDAATRVEVRAALRQHVAGFAGATVLVTHDPLDALVLGHRLVVLEGGRVVQDGRPEQVARHPRTDYVARLVGVNLYRGAATDDRVLLDGGGALTVLPGARGRVFAAVRPSAVAVYRTRPDGSPRNVWPARVAGLEWAGDRVRVQTAGALPAAVDVTPAAVAELGLAPGVAVWLAVKATEVAVYPE